MIVVPLTRGYEALLDDQDAHLAARKWAANVKPSGTVYAVSGKRKLHREVLGIRDRFVLVDHRDGNGLDCRRANLRVATKGINAHNVPGARPDALYSKHRGVSFNRRARKWIAQMKWDGKNVGIGYYDSEVEANIARLLYERERIGIQPRRLVAFQEAGLCV